MWIETRDGNLINLSMCTEIKKRQAKDGYEVIAEKYDGDISQIAYSNGDGSEVFAKDMINLINRVLSNERFRKGLPYISRIQSENGNSWEIITPFE